MYSICRFYLIKMVCPCIRIPKPSVMEKIHKEFTKGGKVIHIDRENQFPDQTEGKSEEVGRM